jgi:hypothetical protein
MVSQAGKNKQPQNQCLAMEPNPIGFPRLADIEREVAAEGREWARQRLQERLQQLADQHGEVFPPAATKAATVKPVQRVRRPKTGR